MCYKGKMLKVLMGVLFVYVGDYVELSDGGCDFVLVVGVGVVILMKFMWFVDLKLKDLFLLMFEYE